MPLKLYLDYSSQPSRAVLALCIASKIPIQVVETQIFQMKTRSQQFQLINPQKKVPALEDTENKFSMGQSHAIMRYLVALFPAAQQWYPAKDFKKRAKIDEYLDFHHQHTRKCSYLIFNTLFAKKIGLEDPYYNENQALKMVHFALKFVNNIFLASSDYIVGSEPSLADLSAYFEIQFLNLINFDFSKFPKIVAWMARIQSIEAVKKANTVFRKIQPKIKQKRPKL